jgi:hypothetical protein
MPCRPPGAELILFSACGTLGGGPVALCEPRHARGNRGLEADLGPDSEQFSATVRTCERRCGRLTVGASAGASASGDVEGRNATVEYHRLAVGAVSRRDRGNGVHCPGRTNLRIYARECVLRARLADSAELGDRLIRLLGMVERSGEPRSGRSFPHLQAALHEVRCLEPDYGSPLANGWRLGRSPSLFLCCLRSPTRHRTRLPYFRREGSRLDAVMGLV